MDVTYIKQFTSSAVIIRGLVYCICGIGKIVTGFFARPLNAKEFFIVGFSMSAWADYLKCCRDINLCNGVGRLPHNINAEETIKLHEIRNVDAYECKIFVPHTKSVDGHKIISCQSFNNVITGKYSHLFDNFLIIDCRYNFEFNGGHIPGAVNVQSSDLLELLFKANIGINKHIGWIFYCEFSSQRAPRAAHFLRKMDSQLNRLIYPRLCFPHAYVLDGGYNKYFNHCNDSENSRTENSEDSENVFSRLTYVPMDDLTYTNDCIYSEILDRQSWEATKGRRSKTEQKRNVNTEASIHNLCNSWILKPVLEVLEPSETQETSETESTIEISPTKCSLSSSILSENENEKDITVTFSTLR